MADWVAIKTEYVTGNISYRKLAEKYGLNKDTVCRRAKSEGWIRQKQSLSDEIQSKSIQKSVEKIADAEAEIAGYKASARANIWKEIARRMGTDIADMEGPELRRMVQNFCDMNGMESDEPPLKQEERHNALVEAIKGME